MHLDSEFYYRCTSKIGVMDGDIFVQVGGKLRYSHRNMFLAFFPEYNAFRILREKADFKLVRKDQRIRPFKGHIRQSGTRN